MRRALEHARTARGRVAPNPAVGAVVVRDGIIIGGGATLPPPGPHAEVVALAAAGARARGADLYVTLEPCSHHGRTPPCTNAILDAGIRRVVAATGDHDPLVDGRGFSQLRAAGITVEVGLYGGDATELMAGFFHRVRTGRPRVIAKFASSLDGCIATHTGHSRWITGPASRAEVHALRDQVDAILIGVGTLLADDPLLTTRLADDIAGYGGPHHPLRVVLDSVARTPPTARMLAHDTPGSTLILTGPDAPPDRVATLEAAGAEVIGLENCGNRVDIRAALDLLGSRGVNDLFVEGGSGVHGAFFDARLVDHAVIFIAPTIVGGRAAPRPVGGLGVAAMPEAARLVDQQVDIVGGDIRVSGRIVYPGQEGSADV
jgi:diaminohydroxyphosphoribosylaminopyrimidine deaminase / 5-amino-6-(5-phosphoribosylamino)uracil reductase